MQPFSRRFALALGVSALLAAAFGCAADTVAPTTTTTTTTATPTSAPTFTGYLVRASRSTGEVILSTGPLSASRQGTILPTAAVSGIGSMGEVFDKFGDGYRVQVTVTFVAGTVYYPADITAVQVLQMSDPVPSHIKDQTLAINAWGDVVVLQFGSYYQALLTRDTQFVSDSEFKSLDEVKALLPSPPQVCAEGTGFLTDNWKTTLATSIRVWRPASGTYCPS